MLEFNALVKYSYFFLPQPLRSVAVQVVPVQEVDRLVQPEVKHRRSVNRKSSPQSRVRQETLEEGMKQHALTKLMSFKQEI